ncbi:MAG: hypothetical protein WDW36_006161 [Sanguina aurantia]
MRRLARAWKTDATTPSTTVDFMQLVNMAFEVIAPNGITEDGVQERNVAGVVVPKPTQLEALGNFMASSTDPFGCLVVNRAVHKIVYDRLNTSPFRMFDIYWETGPAQRERLPQPASTGNMALMEGLTIGRGALNGFILNLHKMEKGFVAPGKQGKIGIRDDDPVFGDILNAISARSSDTQFYLFSSAVDLECGRRLVPEELQKPLPPLVAQLAGLAQPQDQAAGYTDADRLEQIARGAGQDQLGEPQAAGKRKRAPAKGRKTGGAKQR